MINQVISFRSRYAAEKILCCCGIDTIDATFLDYGGMDRREMFSLSLPTCALSSNTTKIAAQLLFGEGEDRGYGRLFRAVFEFTPLITEQNTAVLHEALASVRAIEHGANKEIFYLGVHLRHTNNRDINGSDYGEVNCMKQALALANPTNKTCIVLVASDRVHTLERMKLNAAALGCHFATSNHTKVLTHSIVY